ncbi:MAG: Crp/Fnr family transcriptional regulator [Myxococcales bacterium]|jgi:CRP-like cAMP-binding protein|nr:Crp/Fnr family transcriptional regulator [Myxococcales bacterium]
MPSQWKSLQAVSSEELPQEEPLSRTEKKLRAIRPITLGLEDYFKIKCHEEKASTLYREGSSCQSVYFIASGCVRLKRIVVDAQTETLVDMLGPGDFCGNLSAEPAARMRESAIPAQGSEIWSIDATDFRRLLAVRPLFAQEFIQAQNDRLRHQQHRLFWITTRNAPFRLILAFIDMAERFGSPSHVTGEWSLQGISQADLAEYIGVVRNLVSRLTCDMRRAGIITTVGRTIYIPSRRRLYELAGMAVPDSLD